MTPETAISILTEISTALDIELPDDDSQLRFYQVQVVNTVKTHQKKAALYEKFVSVMRLVMNGGR